MNIWILSRGCPSEEAPLLGIFEYDQAKALQNAGHNVIFLSLDLRSIRHKRRWGIDEFSKEGIQVIQICVPCGAIPYKLFKAIGRVSFTILYNVAQKKHGIPDVVHAHFGTVADLCADYLRKIGTQFVVTEHNSQIMKEPMPKSVYLSAKNAYAKANKVIAVSQVLADRINALFDVQAEIIGNILDEDKFPLERLQNRCNVGKYVFCATGNLLFDKGFDILLNAFSRLGNQSVELIIFGDGPERDYFHQLAKDMMINEKVTFKGRCDREEIRKTYLESNCFVLPSRHETFGVVYIEAMACGLPIIATKCGGPDNLITEETGILIPVDDVMALTKAMEYMVENKDSFKGQKSIEYVKKHYSSSVIVSLLEKLYQKI